MNFGFPLHSIITLVGPHHCGKSTFSYKLKDELEKKYEGIKVSILSSDEIREELLGYKTDKMGNEMINISEETFKLLFFKLDTFTTYPVNKHIIILDTTGLSEDFRNKVIEISNKNNYQHIGIIFDYKDREDYFLYKDNGGSGNIIAGHIRRLRTEVLGNLQTKKYNKIYKIKSRNDIENFEINIDGFDYYKSCILPKENEYFIIGDIHGCYDEFVSLLFKGGFSIENGIIKHSKQDKKIILIGDYIDKGNFESIVKIIQLIKNNLDIIYVTIGNHERFVYNAISRKEEEKVMQEDYGHFFDSLMSISKNEEVKNNFFYIYEKSKIFFIHFNDNHNLNFVITHSPCEKKYLCKLDTKSKREQIKFDYPKDATTLNGMIDSFLNENVKNYPLHIFGHVSLEEIYKEKNLYGIDTGCCYGNKLTGIFVFDRVKEIQVQSNQEKNLKKLLGFKKNELKEYKKENNSDFDERRLNNLIKNKINYISGTMCPADKNIESEDIESLEKGLLYFKNKGIDKLILEKKHMGNRINVYLNTNIEESFLVSRNGYKVSEESLPIEKQKEAIVKVYEKLKDFMKKYELKELIVDGELMPWYSIGSNLINNTFKVIKNGLHTEGNLLKENGFLEALEDIKNKLNDTDISKDKNILSKDEISKKYGHTIYRTSCNLEDIKNIIPNELEDSFIKQYEEQVDIYGKNSEVYIEMFNLLKGIKENGEEIFFDTLNEEEKYKLVSNNEYLIVDFSVEDYYIKSKNFFDNVINSNEEGIVMKPLYYTEGILPYMKVRNKSYLSLIYGYDYQKSTKYKMLIDKKDTRMKKSVSLMEYNLGQKLLKISRKDITNENKDYINIIMNFIKEEEKEKVIDPRL